MSLFNLGKAYELARFRAQVAEDQQHELEALLAQWFLDRHEGAGAFLWEIAKEYREKHPTETVECAPQQVLQGLNGRGNGYDADEMRSDVADVVERDAGGSGAVGMGAGLGEAALDAGAEKEVSQDRGGGIQAGVRTGGAREL